MVEFKEVRQGLALLEGDQGQEDVAGERQIGGNRGQCAFPFIFVLRDFVWSD